MWKKMALVIVVIGLVMGSIGYFKWNESPEGSYTLGGYSLNGWLFNVSVNSHHKLYFVPLKLYWDYFGRVKRRNGVMDVKWNQVFALP